MSRWSPDLREDKNTAEKPAREDKFDAVIERLTRDPNSTNGSPTYTLHLHGGATIQTYPDSAVNYYVSNSEYLNVPMTLWTRKGKVKEVTRRR